MYPPSPWIGSTRMPATSSAGHNSTQELFFDIADNRFSVILTRQGLQDGVVSIRERRVQDAVHQGANPL